MNVGQKILEAIIEQPMFRMECPENPEAGCMAIWNGNAAEQLEALAFDQKAHIEAKTLAESIHRKEFAEAANWEPLEDTAGIISQIDNMYAGVREQRDMWRQRAHHAEDLLERIRIWHETLSHTERLEQIQSEVARLRRTFENFCAEMMPVCADDSWVNINDRKPTLSTPIVEVLFSNGEIEESQFWVGAFLNDFQRFKSTRQDCEVTHWREKKSN